MMENTTVYGIGVDTGGTFTDAAMIDLSSGKIISVAKTPTTHHNLRLGMSNALENLMEKSGVVPSAVRLIALSTTLATNAVVEGRGADVGLFVIGTDKEMDLPISMLKYIAGGHELDGAEAQALDLESLLDGIAVFRGNVEAYAVCASMSFSNPAHELVAARAISLSDPDIPVFCSHQVSTQAGLKERAATTVINAKLMPVMRDFLDSAGTAFEKMHLTGNICIIRGDASPMNLSDAVQQAAFTVASGPAATSWFGAAFSPSPDALVVDVGGTTTDITMIRDRRPVINPEGSRIAEWQTHVNAVEMLTLGAGGDSHAAVSRWGNLTVGPSRVVPLCMAGEIPDPGKWMGREDRSRCVMLVPDIPDAVISDDLVLNLLRENGPMSPLEIHSVLKTGLMALADRITELVRVQKVAEIGFTPTDALHVLNRVNIGDRDKAVRGAEAMAGETGQTVEAFCESVLAEVERKIGEGVLQYVLQKEFGESAVTFLKMRKKSDLVQADFRLMIPLVGIGAAARSLLPGVARRLGTEVVFPDYYEVGNALGAVFMAADALKKKDTE